MKKLALFTVSLLLASHAMAQAAPNAAEPAANGSAPQTNFAPVIAPAAPASPSVQPLTMAPAGVTSTQAVAPNMTLQTGSQTPPAPTPLPIDLNGAVSKLSTTSTPNQKMGQAIVMGSILNCTQKTAGQQATNAFYQQMQATSKTVEALCKSGQASQARSTVLDTLNAKHNDPVVKAMLNCYAAQSAMVSNLGGEQLAADAAHYSRWLKNPETAKAEMQESDVCRHKTAAQSH